MTLDPNHLPQTSSTFPPASSERAARIAAFVGDLFARFEAILGTGAMRSLNAADPNLVVAEWGRAFEANRITIAEVNRGMATIATRKFAPNLGEFLQACRPAFDPEVAWHEAVAGMQALDRGEPFPWSHPAVYWAACGMRSALRESNFVQSRRRWEAATAEQWQRGQWAEVPVPQKRVERSTAPQKHLDGVPTMPDEVRRRLAEVRMRALAAVTQQSLQTLDRLDGRDSPDFDSKDLEARKEAARVRVLFAELARIESGACADLANLHTVDERIDYLCRVSMLPRDRVEPVVTKTFGVAQ